MPATRKPAREDIYGVIAHDAPPAPPDPETDINVVRGLSWAIGGTILGTVVSISWFVYRLFAPLEGVNEAATGLSDFIVVPVLATLYGLIGAVVGGCIGMAIGLVFIGIAALKESRESEEEEEPLAPVVNGSLRSHY